MKRFLFVLVLLAVGVVGLAYYQEWFHVTVDSNKFHEDRNKVLGTGQKIDNPEGTPALQPKD